MNVEPCRLRSDQCELRWVLVVGVLADGPLRYGESARRLDGVSQKMLTQTLRSLEEDGLVIRTVFAVIPPRADYELTDAGRSLQVPLRALEEGEDPHGRCARQPSRSRQLTHDHTPGAP